MSTVPRVAQRPAGRDNTPPLRERDVELLQARATDAVSIALSFAEHGYHVLPLHWTEHGRCSCGKPPSDPKCKPGKHPYSRLVPKGHHDATTDPATIRQWWALFPDCNVGIALAASGIVSVAPDCPERLADFQRRGLPSTTTVGSGSGEGHEHYWYQRPTDCPELRMCKSADYDLLSDGYIVAPPSVTTGPYVFLSALQPVGELPIAPPWATSMLREEGKRRATAATLPPVANDEPPVRLSDAALAWWTGEQRIHKRNDEVDRSETIWAIGMELAKANASPGTIAAALAERDTALGLNWCTGRQDANVRYIETARRCVARMTSPSATSQPTPTSAPDGMACVAELEQQLAAMTSRFEQIERSEQITATILQVLDNPSYTPQQAVAYIRAQSEYNVLAELGHVDADGEVVLYLPKLSRERPVLDPETGKPILVLDPETGEPVTTVDRSTGEIRTKVKTVAAMSPSTISRALKEVAAISGAFVIGEKRDPTTGRTRITMKPAYPETRRTMIAVATAQVYRDRRRGPGRGKPKDARLEHIELCADCGDQTDVVIRSEAICGSCETSLGRLPDERIQLPFLSETEDFTPLSTTVVVEKATKLKRSQSRDRFHEARARHHGAPDRATIQVETVPQSDTCGLCRRSLRNAEERAEGCHSYDCTGTDDVTRPWSLIASVPVKPTWGGND